MPWGQEEELEQFKARNREVIAELQPKKKD